MTAQGKLVGKKILLVEDQAEVRQATGMLLSLDDHAVTEAVDGDEALELFTRTAFDLVITHCAMPKMSGDKLARVIRQQSPSQPILMMTGSPEVGSIARENVNAVLYKPFALSELREAISKLLTPSAVPA